jgi:hypothetical protein
MQQITAQNLTSLKIHIFRIAKKLLYQGARMPKITSLDNKNA